MLYFGERLIFNEAPEILPDKIQKRIKNQIADKILSETGKEKWWTISSARSEIDKLREDDSKMFSFKTKEEKLEFLKEIDCYYDFLQKKYKNFKSENSYF